MPEESRMLTHQQASSFYNHLGAKQAWQGVYETPATRDLIAHVSCEAAQVVFEFGCETGATASLVLLHSLPPQSMYLAVDSSETLVRLARSRFERFGACVTVRQTDGSPQFGERPGSCDRFVSNDALDLLSPTDMAHLLSEARWLPAAEGACVRSRLTRGATPLARLRTWTHLHALEPRLVGDCRLLELRGCLPDTSFRIDYVRVITRFGIPSEVVVAPHTIE